MKPKICRMCKSSFNPVRPLQRVCGPMCAKDYVDVQNIKKKEKAAALERKQTREKLATFVTKPMLVKKAQKAFNAYVRERDFDQPCISCGKPNTGEPNSVDCGHYYSVGAAVNLRFHEDNAHAQCKHCNQYLAGNHVNYRQGLLERIGLRRLEFLEKDKTLRRYTKEGLIELERYYIQERKKLEANRGFP